MPLRKRQKPALPVAAGGADEKKSKRQRLAAFFRSRKPKKGEDKDAAPVRPPAPAPSPSPVHPALSVHKLMASFVSKIPVPADRDAARKPARDSKIAESTQPAKSTGSVDDQRPVLDRAEQMPTPPPELQEEPKPEPLSEDNIRALFSGAPHFCIKKTDGRAIPTASYPWDEHLTVRDVSDSVQLAQPAFSAATLHRHLPVLQQSADQNRQYQGYKLDVVEVPSMLSAQGLEPGTVGFVHFLELPRSDHLVTDLQQSQTSNEYLEAMRNKELMHNNPERLGIRRVDMTMVHDRLVEFGDLFEAFQDSPERITILNNQSSGDLYANLFGKFLNPPGYDGTVDDPTGMKVQIDTLLKILRTRGVWYDFSLVEWRIRLGQILWSDPEPETENETGVAQLWTEREILLLQITLACELLLRLDAVSSMDVDDVKDQMHVTSRDLDSFLQLKTRKTDWDLVLARRFLENILIVKEGDSRTPIPDQRSRGLLSILGSSVPQEAPKADIILLPQHQAQQLSGLLHFAQTIQWPGLDLILKDLTQKLGIPDASQEPEQPSSYGRFLDPSTPSSISVYGTPLATPRSNGLLDSYFGHMYRPGISRSNSRSLQMPLSSTLLAYADSRAPALDVGGWLSRSYLTGLILPGEAISHFLMSTLLENDKLAIASLGDSANLYGGFIYGERAWWSKASVVARVLGCLDGAAECMGWLTFTKLPEGLTDGWYAISSDEVRFEQPPRVAADQDLVLRDSAIIPGEDTTVSPDNLTLPVDADTPPIPSVGFIQWSLTPINPELVENDISSSPSADFETYIASITFRSFARGTSHTFTLTHDVQFITSWPCTPPTSSPSPNVPRILKRTQQQSLSRTSSKRSIHSTRSASNRPSRQLSRRNSHGYEPLLSHPPDSPGMGPTRAYSPIPDDLPSASPSPKPVPMSAHPLHVAYDYKIVPATDVLDPTFALPFTMHVYGSPVPSPRHSPMEEKDETAAKDDSKTVLVLDTRASKDLELLARAWCAEKGLHAIVGRVGRTCLGCCVREARGLGLNVIIRL